jgi:hypothetical protein
VVGGKARRDLAGTRKILRGSPSRNCVRRPVRLTRRASSVSNPSILRDRQRCCLGQVALLLRPQRVGRSDAIWRVCRVNGWSRSEPSRWTLAFTPPATSRRVAGAAGLRVQSKSRRRRRRHLNSRPKNPAGNVGRNSVPGSTRSGTARRCVVVETVNRILSARCFYVLSRWISGCSRRRQTRRAMKRLRHRVASRSVLPWLVRRAM